MGRDTGITGVRTHRLTGGKISSPSWLPWVENIYNSHDNSPSSAAAVCSEHFIIHMITAPHQRLPCVVNIL